jgi:hypothetical protein
MRRAAFLWIAFVGALMAGGCSVPHYDVPYDSAGQPTVASIINRVKCEIIDMVRNDKGDGYVPTFHRDFLLNGDYEVAISLSVEVNDTGGLAPSLAYINPISKAASFMFGGSATLSESRDHTFTENIQLSTRKIYLDWKNKTGGMKYLDCDAPAATNLAGTLGIKDFVAMAALTDFNEGQQPGQSQPPAAAQQCPTPAKSPATPKCPAAQPCSCPQQTDTQKSATTQFGGSIQFVVTKNINTVGPTWSLTHFKGPGGLLNLSEVNTDKITLAFAQGPNAGQSLVVSNRPNTDAYKLLQQILTNSINTQLQMLQNPP